jgi:accessory gene regulator B
VIQAIAEEISLRLVANKIIAIEKRKYYTYGVELVLDDLIIFLTISIIGALTGKIIISLIYAVTYCPIRNYVGGYHCKTHMKCYFTTLFLYIAMLLFNYYLLNSRLIVSSILIAIAIPAIFIFSPVDYGTDPISDDDRKKYRVKSILLLTIAFCGFILATTFHQTEISFAISWGIFMVFSLMLLSLLTNLSESRQKKNGKEVHAQVSLSSCRTRHQKSE